MVLRFSSRTFSFCSCLIHLSTGNLNEENAFSREISKVNSRRAHLREKNRAKLTVDTNYGPKMRVDYNNGPRENSLNFLRTFEVNKTSPFFIEKPRKSRISWNYVLITFAQYCTLPSCELHFFIYFYNKKAEL